MSGFVPFRDPARFEARLVGASQEKQPATEPSTEQQAQTGIENETAADVSPSTEEDELLPQTVEELHALIAHAQEEARSAAAAELSDLKTTVEAERTALNCLVDSVDEARKIWAREVRSQLGEVLLVGIRQIVSESAQLQSEALQQRIAEVGERLIGEQKVLLRVRSDDVDAARALIEDREGWQVVADDDLVAGGCVVETDGGQIDATMGAAFAGLSGSVKDWMDGAEESEE